MPSRSTVGASPGARRPAPSPGERQAERGQREEGQVRRLGHGGAEAVAARSSPRRSRRVAARDRAIDCPSGAGARAASQPGQQGDGTQGRCSPGRPRDQAGPVGEHRRRGAAVLAAGRGDDYVDCRDADQHREHGRHAVMREQQAARGKRGCDQGTP